MTLLDDREATEFAAAELLLQVEDAQRSLATADEIPDHVVRLVEGLDRSLHVARPRSVLAAVDPYLVEMLLGGAVASLTALRQPDAAGRRRGLRVGLEQMRQALRDMVEEAPVAEDRPVDEIARWLVASLDVPQGRIAEALGVGARTLQRWMSGDSTPSGDDAARLRALARVAGHLRHAFTGPGVVEWMSRPHPDLDGRAPGELLRDPLALPDLLRLASRARSSTAA